jgi:predicted phosphodiesterase
MDPKVSDEFAKKVLEELASPGKTGSDRRAQETPEAFRPRMDIDHTSGGFVVSTPRPAGNSANADEILVEFGLDPAEWKVTSVRQGKWQTFNENWLESFRVSVVPANYESSLDPDLDLEKLIDEIKKWKPTKGSKQVTGDGAFVIAPSDQQIGKKANGHGTEQSIQRILGVTEGAFARYQELNKIGRNLGTVAMLLAGDHVEGNVSQGGRLQSPAASDLGQTEQTRVARRLLMQQIKAFAPHCEEIIISVVNGNHDEVTRQVVADPSDGWNVEIASAVQDACAENPELAHVKFRYPEKDHQTLTIDIKGTLVGLFHGHQSGRDVVKYLSGQAAGQTALGQADVWVSGHFHHFKALDIGSRLWLQAPTTDPGSAWWRDRSGLESKPGLLTFTVGKNYDPRRDISVIQTD